MNSPCHSVWSRYVLWLNNNNNKNNPQWRSMYLLKRQEKNPKRDSCSGYAYCKGERKISNSSNISTCQFVFPLGLNRVRHQSHKEQFVSNLVNTSTNCTAELSLPLTERLPLTSPHLWTNTPPQTHLFETKHMGCALNKFFKHWSNVLGLCSLKCKFKYTGGIWADSWITLHRTTLPKTTTTHVTDSVRVEKESVVEWRSGTNHNFFLVTLYPLAKCYTYWSHISNNMT